MVAHDGKIYAFGGLQGTEAAPTRTAEVYDPVKDEWESIPPMFTANHSAGAASLGGKIFVVGGVGTGEGYGYRMLYSGECYDPTMKIWTRIPDKTDFSGGCEALAIDGAIFVADYGHDVLE